MDIALEQIFYLMIFIQNKYTIVYYVVRMNEDLRRLQDILMQKVVLYKKRYSRFTYFIGIQSCLKFRYMNAWFFSLFFTLRHRVLILNSETRFWNGNFKSFSMHGFLDTVNQSLTFANLLQCFIQMIYFLIFWYCCMFRLWSIFADIISYYW